MPKSKLTRLTSDKKKQKVLVGFLKFKFCTKRKTYSVELSTYYDSRTNVVSYKKVYQISIGK